MEQIGFVGLGVMGAPMAGHLVSKGHSVTVWNRTPEKRVPLVEQGAKSADTLRDLAQECSIIFLCVTRTEDVDACLKEIVASAKPGTLVVDHSTISPTGAEKFHEELRGLGYRFVDAPITGGSMGAKAGTLTIFCGGEEEDIERARPYLEAYGKRIERVGGPGSGQMMKVANQIAVGGALLALCESMAFAKKAGLDLAQTRELLKGGAAGSWAFEFYGPKILESDWSPGFSVKNQLKDFKYCFEAAQAVDIELPTTKLADELLTELEQAGGGEDTTARLYETLLGKEYIG